LRATRFAKNLTWAKEIGPDGRPVLNPNQEPTVEGTLVCPSLNGAANWYSTAFSPQTGLYYVQTLENCNIFTKREDQWAAGKSFWGGAYRQAPEGPNQKILRAFDVKTGKIAWELPEIGSGLARGGVLATASGVLFSCDDSDKFLAHDAANGKLLWQFPMNVPFRASPMTYQFDKQQYVAVAAGTNVIAFGLVE
jgi:alcohol dehydrogenase (cytochrome c)